MLTTAVVTASGQRSPGPSLVPLAVALGSLVGLAVAFGLVRARGQIDGDLLGATVEVGFAAIVGSDGRGAERGMARPLILALGGTRSGKSRFGLAAARDLAGTGRAWFLATAWPGDPEMDDRIARHRRERPADWPTIEVGADLAAAIDATEPAEPLLIDGLTLWLSAILGDEPAALDPLLDGPVAAALEAIARRPGAVIVVSDDVGGGIVPMHAGARAYRDLVGMVHQRIAAEADEVVSPGGRPAAPAQGTGDMTEPTCRRPPTPTLATAERSTTALARIAPLDVAAMAAAAAHLDRLTKPPGSLGRLETLLVELAGITGRVDAPVARRTIVVAAADHGVVRQGVSAYPSDVTAQMVANFLAGGAAINALAAAAGADVVVVDAGVATRDPGRAGRSRRGGRSSRGAPARPSQDPRGNGGHDRGPGDVPCGCAPGDRRRARPRRGAAGRRASTWSGSARWGSATRRPPAR